MLTRLLPLFLLGGLSLALAAAAQAQAPVGSRPEKVVMVEGVTEYRYPNGARLVLFPDPSRPTITVN
ncbi:MAG: hypothetical protein ACOYK7_17145, partial [Pirellulales bacterium]